MFLVDVLVAVIGGQGEHARSFVLLERDLEVVPWWAPLM
jgi:hypothetical protein